MRIKHTTGAAGSLVHDGVVYQPEEDGYFRIPFDLAQTLLQHPFWEAEPARVVVHELPATVEEQTPPTDPEKPADAPDSGEELTPAQKAAITRAANKAAAEAETN